MKNPSLESQKKLKSTEERPEVSVSEDDEFVCVEAFLPDLSLKEIKMNFNKGMLSIQADKNEKKLFYKVAIPGFFNEKMIPKAAYKENILKVVFTKNRNTFIKK